MNDSRHASLLSCFLIIALASGCAAADDFASTNHQPRDVSQYDRPSGDTQAIAREADAISMAAVQAGRSSRDATRSTAPTTSLVSATVPAVAPHRPLYTLASTSSLDRAIAEAPGTVILDFYADWCGPCRQQGKILHQMEPRAAQTGTTIIKINVDEHAELAQQLGVSSLPTLMVVNDGRITERQVGLASEARLWSWIR